MKIPTKTVVMAEELAFKEGKITKLGALDIPKNKAVVMKYIEDIVEKKYSEVFK